MAESGYTHKVVESFDRYFSKEIIAGLSGKDSLKNVTNFLNYINFWSYSSFIYTFQIFFHYL